MTPPSCVLWVFPNELTVRNRAVYQRLLYFARRVPVCLVTREDTAISDELQQQLYSITRVSVRWSGGLISQIARYWSGVLRELIRRKRDGIVWVHTFGNHSLLTGWVAKRFFRCAWVADIRDSPERQFGYLNAEGTGRRTFRWLYRSRIALTKALLKVADVVIVEGMTLDAGLPARLAREYRISRSRTVVAPNGTLVEYTSALAKERSSAGHSFRVLYLGMIRRARGIAELIEGIEILRFRRPEHDIRLVLIGPFASQREQEHFERDIAKNRRTDWIEITGRLPHEAALKEAATCDVGTCILPWGLTFDEAYPIKLFEYMALGLPVVASDHASIREVVRPNIEAILVPDLKPSSIADSVGTLLVDARLRNSIAAAARQRVKLFDWDLVNEAIFCKTQTILSRASSGRG